jgi:hypothetical protein
MLSIRTTYFDNAKKGGWQEALTGEFRFPEHSTYGLYRMLQYVYTGDYSLEVEPLGADIGTTATFSPLCWESRLLQFKGLVSLISPLRLCVFRQMT